MTGHMLPKMCKSKTGKGFVFYCQTVVVLFLSGFSFNFAVLIEASNYCADFVDITVLIRLGFNFQATVVWLLCNG